MSVTCNVGYIPDDDYAENASVGNFYGDSLSPNDFQAGKFDTYGTPIPADIAPPELLYQLV